MTSPQRRVGIRTRIQRSLIALLGLGGAAVFAITTPHFLSGANLSNLIDDVALTGIVALPAVLLIMAGQIDLSVGAAAAFTGIVLADVAPAVGIGWAVVLAVAVGVLTGVLNGVLVSFARIDAPLATLATMALLRGLAFLVPSGLAVVVSSFRALGRARPLPGMSVPVLVLIAAAIIVAFAAAGKIGSRARKIGTLRWRDQLSDRMIVVALFVLSGAAASLAGIIRVSELGTGLPTATTGLEITVLAAVLLGGGRLRGGYGSVWWTLAALLMIGIIDNGLSLRNITPYANQVFHAALLVIAVALDGGWVRKRGSDDG